LIQKCQPVRCAFRRGSFKVVQVAGFLLENQQPVADVVQHFLGELLAFRLAMPLPIKFNIASFMPITPIVEK
jgi:hypothetical protein